MGPDCVRCADSTVGRRAAGRRPRAGGTTAGTFTSQTRLRCAFRWCFFQIRAPVACRRPPPTPPDHHCAGFLWSGAPETACRTQTGRPGSRMCRVFALLRGQNRVPPVNRATWTPSGPTKPGRFSARETRVARIARGTSIRGRRTVKTLRIRDPGRPDRARHADF